jgi:hypothetical protein
VDDCLPRATWLLEKSRTNSRARFPPLSSFSASSSNLARDIFVDELTTMKRDDESLRVPVYFEKEKGRIQELREVLCIIFIHLEK